MLYLNKYLFLLTDFLQIYKDTCKKAYSDNPLYSCSTSSLTWKAGSKMTGVQLDYRTDDKLRILLENYLRVGPSCFMSKGYVKRREKNSA